MSSIKNVLCVIDPTAETQYALQRSIWFAKLHGAELKVLHCHYDDFLRGHVLLPTELLAAARDNDLAEQKKRLAELIKPALDAGIKCDAQVVWDHPLADGIARHAIAENVDIVFKDTHKHAALGFGRLSNTDWSLMRACPIPLWFVKSRELPQHLRYIAAIDPFSLDDKQANLDSDILQLSLEIAKHSQGELHAFHAFDVRVSAVSSGKNSSLSIDEIEEEARDSLSGKINELAETVGIAAARTHLLSGPAHSQLPILAEQLDATAVIMGAVSRNRLQQIFIGATAEVTLDRLHCDLIVVKPSWALSTTTDNVVVNRDVA